MEDTTRTEHTPHTDPITDPAAAPVGAAATDDPDKTKILITYILYIPGILLAVILPLIFKGKGSAFAEGHYRNQISIAWRGFVLSIAAFVLSMILTAVGVGFVGQLLSLAAWVWIVIRAVKGLMQLTSGKPAVDTGWGI